MNNNVKRQEILEERRRVALGLIPKQEIKQEISQKKTLFEYFYDLMLHNILIIFGILFIFSVISTNPLPIFYVFVIVAVMWLIKSCGDDSRKWKEIKRDWEMTSNIKKETGKQTLNKVKNNKVPDDKKEEESKEETEDNLDEFTNENLAEDYGVYDEGKP